MSDIIKQLVKVDFTPLSEFTKEKIEWTCKRCLAKERDGIASPSLQSYLTN